MSFLDYCGVYNLLGFFPPPYTVLTGFRLMQSLVLKRLIIWSLTAPTVLYRLSKVVN